MGNNRAIPFEHGHIGFLLSTRETNLDIGFCCLKPSNRTHAVLAVGGWAREACFELSLVFLKMLQQMMHNSGGFFLPHPLLVSLVCEVRKH